MRRVLNSLAPVLALGGAWWLSIELAAVWGPSLITIFGQAAETPPELIGLFALGCVLASYVVCLDQSRLPLGALAVAVGARLLLAFVPGGQLQLWASSIGIAAALGWFASLAGRHGPHLAGGIAVGWLAHVTTAAAGGTWLPVWRTDWYAVTALVVLVVLVVGTARPALRPTGTASRRQAWSVLPLCLVAGVAIVNPGRASATQPDVGPLVLVTGCAAAVLGALLLETTLLTRGARLAGGVVALAATLAGLYGTGTVAGVEDALVPWVLLAFGAGPFGLVVLLVPDRAGSRAGAPAVLGGAVVWVLLFFAYYAGYDLGYRADAVLVAALVVVVVAAVLRAPVELPARRGIRPALVAGAAGTAVLVTLAGAVTQRVPSGQVNAPTEVLTVVAYNVRMGYDLDGRFAAPAVADVLAGADVVLLSEIDRGWLLNGGQDQLAVLARATGKRLYFNPAADPVWGDAVLTDLPVEEVRGRPLPSSGAVTGAGMLAVRARVADRRVWFVSTHVQPTQDRVDGTIDQARAVARMTRALAEDGTPVVLGGDFNFEPDTPSFRALTRAGLTDALTRARPLPTSDSADPTEQIDHVLTTGPWTVRSAGVRRSTASDHLPVRVRLSLRR